MVRKDSVNYSKGKLAVGYGVIALLIGAIVYLYISEWRQLEKLEQEVKPIISTCAGTDARVSAKETCLFCRARRRKSLRLN